MSNRRINVLASILVVLSAAYFNQAIPVNDAARRSISSPEPCGSGDENQSAIASDESDDASDDFESLHGTLNWSPSGISISQLLGDETIIGPSYPSRCATLKSQHILLRL
jgi:hypothetical protein